MVRWRFVLFTEIFYDFFKDDTRRLWDVSIGVHTNYRSQRSTYWLYYTTVFSALVTYIYMIKQYTATQFFLLVIAKENKWKNQTNEPNCNEILLRKSLKNDVFKMAIQRIIVHTTTLWDDFRVRSRRTFKSTLGIFTMINAYVSPIKLCLHSRHEYAHLCFKFPFNEATLLSCIFW